jgi:DNA-binding beta-propeller fold protein YncE
VIATAGISGLWLTANAQTAVDAPEYRVVFERTMDSGGGLGELIVDSSSRRLYGVGTKVIDLDRSTIVDSMSATMGHGFAFAPELNRGISRRGAVFETQSQRVLRPGAGYSATAVAYDEKTKLAAVNYDTLLIVDVVNARLRSVVPLGNSSYVVADGRGYFYVSLVSDTLIVIDAERATIRHRWQLGSCRTPAGMAIDRWTRRLMVSCENRRLVVVDCSNGRIVTELSIPVADQIAFDPTRRLLFIPSELGTLTIAKEVDRQTFRIVGGIPVGAIHSAVAVDPRSGTVYLVHFGRRPSDSASIVLIALALGDSSRAAIGTNGRQ